MSLNAKERITKAKISLQKNYPFWAYLSLFLKFKEIEKGKMMCDTMGVNCETGEIFYVKDFINELSDSELIGVIAHEINHIAFLTSLRLGSRDRDGWNCATDLAINSLLKLNGFILAKGGIIPDYNDEIDIGNGKKITKCSEKTAEEIYDLFPKICQKGKTYIIGEGKGKGKELGDGFDEHIKGKDGKVLSPKEKAELIEDWNGKLQEALTIAKMKGNIPKGIERLIGNLHQEKINWKTLLQRYITNQIPYNHTYSSPHKKSQSCGFYMPNTLKEKISIVIAIDVSGSIGQQELTDFLSEIIGMAKAFQDRIEMTLITHETDVNDVFLVRNGSIDEIKKLKIEGGGGTAHDKVFEHIQNKIRDCKCVVFLTDGYSDLDGIDFNKYSYNKIFVISKGGTDSQLKNKNCHKINLDD